MRVPKKGRNKDPEKVVVPLEKSQARSWCFTMWSEEDVGRLRAVAGINAICVGEEVCPKTGKVHFQGYVRFDNNKRFSWWKSQFPTAHVELRRGSEAEAAAYCRKDRKIIVDQGCCVSDEAPGDTKDRVIAMIQRGAPLWQVYRFNPRFYFDNRRKIVDLESDMKAWRESNVDFTGDI